jgi:hypothetical protein
MTGHPKRRLIAWIGGIAACVVLIAAGIAYVVVGVNGRNEVHDNVAREQIVGTPDMTPTAIREEIAAAGLKNVQDVPTCSVAGEAIDNGDKAKCFASYMRIHALEASGGQTYAQLGRYLDKSGNPTSDEKAAAVDPKSGRPVENPVRQTWVTETALSTGLNMAFFAEQVSIFGIVMGICMIVIGIGLGVLTVFAIGLAPWKASETEGGSAASGSPAATT